MPKLDVVTVALISAAIATIALVTSVITLWRSHFALLKPIAVVGQLRQRIYPSEAKIKSGFWRALMFRCRSAIPEHSHC
jgi:hypothetical protein